MTKQTLLRLLAIVAACSIGGIASAGRTTSEVEPNNPIASAQPLTDASDVTISAYLGNNGDVDVDYYVFYAKAGNVLNIDIDNGYGGNGSKNVDTCIAVLGAAPSYDKLRDSDDLTGVQSLDEGSSSRMDSRIDNFVAPVTGYYTVGVSNFGRCFLSSGGGVTAGHAQQGDYDLVISGGSSPIQEVAIDIKPGDDEIAPINPKSRGRIPVALLGGPQFHALNVDPAFLTFGSTGYENSLVGCDWAGTDVNGDGRVDVVCHFDMRAAAFEPTDSEATVRGRTKDGVEFEGTGFLKVVPAKAQF